ncbi:hypothetical protein BGX30_002339, partial [Mortierella sp. GBA39]
MSVPSSHIDWALEKKAGKEHVLLPKFVLKFQCIFVSLFLRFKVLELNMEYASWVNDTKEVNGQRTEHVSFSSFVKKFGLTDKELAMTQYERLLNLPRMKTGRRRRLRAFYDAFLKARMASFCPSWDREQADKEFNVSCETVVKRTAIMAQRASLAVVLLYGIINTLSPDSRRFRLSKKIMMESSLPSLGPETQIHTAVKDVLAAMLKALYPSLDKDQYSEPDFVKPQQKMWQLLSETASSRKTQEEKARYTTLLVVQQIVLWIELKVFVQPTSEHVFVSGWSTLFNILLRDTTMGAILGELASKASASARQAAEQAYGSTTSTPCGRKTDMSIRIQVRNEWKQDIVIFEFKSSQATKQMLQRQQKKSVRLNAAIMMDLEAHGLNIKRSYPIVAEGQGLSLDFYTLRRYEDVLGAGRATAKGISLPSQVTELRTFLQGDTFSTLMTFR